MGTKQGLSASNTNPEQRSSDQVVWTPEQHLITGCVSTIFVPDCVFSPRSMRAT